jgi:tetratricopeptide (TPR) repeat protein
MRRCICILAGAIALSGCVLPPDERVRDYNEDGVYLFEHANYGAARESFQAALALQPDDAAMLFNLGSCYDRLGDSAKAEKAYHDCLEREPGRAACRHAVLVLLVRTHRQPQAEQLVQEWLAKEPKRAEPYAEAGWLARQSGDLPGAQARLQKGLELEPHDQRALTELGQVYEAMQRPDRALVLYERILARDPKQVEISERVNYLLLHGAGRPHPE